MQNSLVGAWPGDAVAVAREEGGALRFAPRQLFALVHGLYWFVVNLSLRARLLIAVDDVHASDEPSLRFLLYLAQRLEGLPVALGAVRGTGYSGSAW